MKRKRLLGWGRTIAIIGIIEAIGSEYHMNRRSHARHRDIRTIGAVGTIGNRGAIKTQTYESHRNSKGYWNHEKHNNQIDHMYHRKHRSQRDQKSHMGIGALATG